MTTVRYGARATQVNREIAHPKLKNLERAGFVIFVYSMLFTSLVSFFAVMIIPDSARHKFLDNLIGGLSMFLVGPISARLLFHGFVVLVGTLLLWAMLEVERMRTACLASLV